MDNKTDTKTSVSNNGITLPAHEYSGLAEVAEKLKPTIPTDQNGFMPLTDFDPKKPYEDWQKFIEARCEKVENSKLTLDDYATKLKDAHDSNQVRREEHFTQRTEDWKKHYEARIGDLQKYHENVLTIKDDKIQELETDVQKLKDENKDFRDRHEADVRNRMNDLENYHNEIARLTREVADAKLERLAKEQAHLDTAREKLFISQDALANAQNDWLESWMTKVKECTIAKFFK